MSLKTINLDHNATAPLDPRVRQVMAEADATAYANPASSHAAGRLARQTVENARDRIAQRLGARSGGTHADRVIFTSGATEANNLAIRGLCGRSPGRVVLSAVEHPSVAGPAEFLARSGFEVAILPVDRHGVVRTCRLADLLDDETRLVSVMLGNNETGVIQPVAELSEICRQADVAMHTDAVQAVGKIPVDFRDLGVTAMTVSAHKFHGPRGIGALVLRHGVAIEPLLFGGFQQSGMRPGTESVTLAVGMAAALDVWHEEHVERQTRLAGLRERFEVRLREGWPSLAVHSASVKRLPHTSHVSFPGLDRQALVMALDLAGICCATGSACASGSSEPSAVLLAMGCPSEHVESAVRFSLGAFTTAAEIEEAAARVLRVCGQQRPRSGGRKPAFPAPLPSTETL